MNAEELGALVRDAVPDFAKRPVTFSRTTKTAYDPITATDVGTTTLTWSGTAVARGARGSMTESFADNLAIRQRYVILTVFAENLSYKPQQGDVVTYDGEAMTVAGVEAIPPNSDDVAVYEVTCQR